MVGYKLSRGKNPQQTIAAITRWDQVWLIPDGQQGDKYCLRPVNMCRKQHTEFGWLLEVPLSDWKNLQGLQKAHRIRRREIYGISGTDFLDFYQ